MYRALPVFSVLPVLAAAAPVPPALFHCIDPNLEVTVWAASPLLRNPTNIDIDQHGRIWVAEGVNYRKHFDREPKGDRIMVLEDTDGDGKADKSWPFVQEPFLRAPLGVAVIGNKVVVSMAPDLVVYTDKDGDAVFDAAKGDTREVLLTGFNGRNHDHSLHSVTVGPDGKWYFSAGNCGAKFTDKSGKTFRIAAKQNVSWWPKDPERPDWDPNEIAGQKSDDGRVYVGGFIARMDPDGSNVEILAHNLRNSYENCVTSFGDIFASDNDDQPACRVFWVLEGGNYGFASADGQRTWQADRRPGQSIQTATWRQEDPGVAPAGDIYGGGAPTGCVFYENGALDDVWDGGQRLGLLGTNSANPVKGYEDAAGKRPVLSWEGTLLVCESARNTIFYYQPKTGGTGTALERKVFLTTNTESRFRGTDFTGGAKQALPDDLTTQFRPSDVCVGPDGAIYISDWRDPRVGGHADMDEALQGTIYRVAPKRFVSRPPKVNLNTSGGKLDALTSPAVHVRALAASAITAEPRDAAGAFPALIQQVLSFQRAQVMLGMQRKSETDARVQEELISGRMSRWMPARYSFVLGRCGPSGQALLPGLAALDSPGLLRAVYLAMTDETLASSDLHRLLTTAPHPFAARETLARIQSSRGLAKNSALARLMAAGSASTFETVTRLMAKDDSLHARILAALAGTLKWQESRDRAVWRLACKGRETGVFDMLIPVQSLASPLRWSDQVVEIAAALHPPQSIPAFQTRALAASLPLQARLDALTAIGFNDTAEAAQAMLEVAVKLTPGADGRGAGAKDAPAGPQSSGDGPKNSGGGVPNSEDGAKSSGGGVPNSGGGVKDPGDGVLNFETARVRETARWWLLNRKDSTWKAHGLNAVLKERGLYDPEKITLLPAPLPAPVAATFSVADAAKLPGDAKRGEAVSAKCFLCHKVGDQGVDYGPDLTTFGRTQTTEALLRSIIEPDADLAHGFAGTRVETGDGIIIEGLLLSESDPLIIRSAGGVTQMVPLSKVKSKTALTRSLMMSAAQLGLTAQEAADVTAYLRGR